MHESLQENKTYPCHFRNPLSAAGTIESHCQRESDIWNDGERMDGAVFQSGRSSL